MNPRTEEIKGRLKAISPAPWCKEYCYSAIRHVERNCDIECGEDHGDEMCNRFGRYDGKAIAQFPEDIAFLLAEIERLEGENAILKYSIAPNTGLVPPKDGNFTC